MLRYIDRRGARATDQRHLYLMILVILAILMILVILSILMIMMILNNTGYCVIR